MTDVRLANNEKGCFVCGVNNPQGFHLTPELGHDGLVRLTLRIPAIYQGYDGLAHGGIISTVLDEVMAYCFFSRGIWSLTAEINVKFLKALPVEHEITIFGELTEMKRKIGKAVGWIEDSDAIRYAESKGRFFLPEDRENI